MDISNPDFLGFQIKVKIPRVVQAKDPIPHPVSAKTASHDSEDLKRFLTDSLTKITDSGKKNQGIFYNRNPASDQVDFDQNHPEFARYNMSLYQGF